MATVPCSFGATAPLKELQHKFGFAPEKIIEAARALAQAGARPAG